MRSSWCGGAPRRGCAWTTWTACTRPVTISRVCKRAPAKCSTLAPTSPLFLVVEKILGAGEQLPPEWPVHGTTGYEFAFVVNNLFVDRRNERALDDIYTRFIRRERESFDDIVYRSKKQAMHETMSGDINSLGHQLNRFSERNRHFRDFTLYSLISTLKEVIACFPVYRTYITPDQPVTEHDRRYVTEAIRCAKRRVPAFTPLLFDFVAKLLLKETRVTAPEECEARARITGKFQQITSPVAAKGIEDAAMYVYNRLVSLNEVGSDPTRFGLEPAEVHGWMSRASAPGHLRCRRPRRTTRSAVRTCAHASTCCQKFRAPGSQRSHDGER